MTFSEYLIFGNSFFIQLFLEKYYVIGISSLYTLKTWIKEQWSILSPCTVHYNKIQHWIPINVFYLFLAGFTEIELQNTVFCLWNLILYWWKHPRKRERREKHLICVGDHPCIMSAKSWVGGVRKMAIFADFQYYQCWCRWVGPKKAKSMLT